MFYLNLLYLILICHLIFTSTISYIYSLFSIFTFYFYRYVAPEILRGDRYGVEVRTLQHYCYHYMVSSRCMQHITSLTTHTHIHTHIYVYVFLLSFTHSLSYTLTPSLPPSHTHIHYCSTAHSPPSSLTPPPPTCTG